MVTRHSCIGKFKRRARRSTSYFRGMIYEVAENEHAYPISSLESTPLCAKSRLFRFRVDRFERGTNREEIMIMKRRRIRDENLTRREGRKCMRRGIGRLTNRWRGKLDYTSSLREKDVSRFVDVSHFVLKRHDRHILENTCCYARATR